MKSSLLLKAPETFVNALSLAHTLVALRLKLADNILVKFPKKFFRDKDVKLCMGENGNRFIVLFKIPTV